MLLPRALNGAYLGMGSLLLLQRVAVSFGNLLNPLSKNMNVASRISRKAEEDGTR